MNRAGVIATVAGAALVVSLLLSWWGPPPVLIDPPADLPGELDFIADAYEMGPQEFEEDAFAFFGVRDIVWLATGMVAFAFGLAGLTGSRATRPLAVLGAILGAASLVLIAIALISPPDYVDVTNELVGDRSGLELDYDVPFGRKLGGFVALVASLGVCAGAALTLSARSR